MILLIDNYDSFTFNIVHFLSDLGMDTTVVRNDKITPREALDMSPEAIVISPGPCTPNEAGICLDLIKATAEAEKPVPVFGICLGHQSIGQAFGGDVISCHEIKHGKLSKITHNEKGLFEGLPNPLNVTRYHSLVVSPKNLPDCLEVTAKTDDGIIMGISHKTLPIHSVQFHPESIATQQGHNLLANFLTAAGCDPSAPPPTHNLELEIPS
ncbi:Nitrogen metabolism transcriptional regulator NtrC protein [Candidatus Micropelagos thuwalensis]|uniref:Nitrogen metabolism transcriptional regulator NtrC protein n=1 Tax=Candidatus Micropelagius thuwalensis TaxID=1397666 RepID=U2WCQ9_9PROT|nr:aminodeoxychorismate/anthranilate synthase component II [Candidatus Micropelagos thuwalensis]ERL47304.1 Nitrogen metabolism transcriptional regulator NtrC protein [Candidatus Micropelagos thuwalensis]